ncbi:unnamed protein product [Candida verbasci]|uniref:Ribosome biogenesis protein ALB1 n=1 Tax=Candida verbasci TaxID=1227364 RepID=A0A9W4TZN2_9ASCO|nr:unnamed protein product [Candida verbasci]
MAGRNAINKPKIKMLAQSHAKSLGKKRANRRTIATRSSTSRYAEKHLTAPRPTDSKAVALFTGQTPSPVSIMTTTTLSNKRAKKIARNQKYLQSKLDEDLKMKEEDEEIQPSKLENIKKTLWKVIENYEQFGYQIKPDSEGTTLGIQSF